MTDKEKVKAYDEALERAQKATRAGSDVAMDIVQYIFPQLAESDDEKIRKAIVSLVYESQGTYKSFAGIDLNDMVAWLEKQKEPKPRWEITSPHTTKWTWEMINEKFDELCGLERPGEREADNETEARKACDHNTGEKIRENSGWIITPHKEFFKWIYERLIHVHKENPNVDYMRSLKERIDNMPSDEPQWKPTDSHLRFLRAVVNDPKNAGAESCHIALKSLLEELEKL